MARTIAEVLAYNRAYSPKLNPNIFDEDGAMYPEVQNKIIEIVDAFLDYTQIKEDVKVYDIRIVGSNASYNYNENSDLDIHIVTDLSKISKPETIANLYFTEVKHAFKEAYDITIKGIDVELYVEDVNASAVTNGIYSVSQDKWIKEPEKMKDPTESELSQAEAIEDEIIAKLDKADDEEAEDIINQLYVMRKDALATVGETAPANLAFKSLRNKGIIKRAKDEVKKAVSKRLSLESKKMRESRRRVREMARTQNKYWIYTEDYSRLKKDERERSEFLMDSDNTSAYGVDDLIYKLNQLKDMNIKVKKIYQTYRDETSTDVTDRYRRYLL